MDKIEIGETKMPQLILVQRGLVHVEGKYLEISKVRSKADNEQAAEFLKGVREMYKTVEAERKPLAKALDDAKKRVQESFMPTLRKLEEIGEAVKRGMEAWVRSEQDRLRKLEAKREEENRAKVEAYEKEVNAGNVHAQAPALKVTPTKPQTAEGQSIRMVKKFQVRDMTILPIQYMVPDEKAIRDAIHSGVTTIPGVHIWEEPQVSIRI